MIEQVTERAFEVAGQSFPGKNDAKKLRTRVASLLAGHFAICSPEIPTRPSCSASMTGAVFCDGFSTDLLDGMHTHLRALIVEYLAAVELAVSLLERSGVPRPSSHKDWIFGAPESGELEGGASFRRHGVGCWVQLPAGAVDFDFGTRGEITAVDVWRLLAFARTRLADFGFASKNDVLSAFQSSVASGELVAAGYASLYFLKEDAV